MDTTKKKKQTWKTVVLGVGLLVLAALAAFGLSQLFITKETKTFTGTGVTTTNVMVCEAEQPAEAFFAPTGAMDVQHTVKMTYYDKDVTEIAYEYEADFGSPDAANAAEARVHADYNIFMGKYADDFSAQFMPMGDELKITVFAKAENLGSETSRVFFISPEDFASLETYKVDDMVNIFRRKGFACEAD